jgi:hypothetical protein
LTVSDSNNHDDITISLDLAGCVVNFKHRLPTKGEIMSLTKYCLTQGDTPWNPSSFSDQVADVFYKQIIDTESHSANIMKLFPYDPSDNYENSICPKMSMKVQFAHAMPIHTDPHYINALPSNIDYKRLSLILHLDHMMSYRIH